MSNTYPNLTPINDAFGLHFRGDHGDTSSEKIRKLELRVSALENEIKELKQLFVLKSIHEDNDVTSQSSSSSLFSLDYLRNIFVGIFYKAPVQELATPSDKTIFVIEEKPEPPEKNRTGPIPKAEADVMLANLITKRDKDYAQWKEELGDEKTRAESFAKFNKDRTNEINAVFDDMEAKKGF